MAQMTVRQLTPTQREMDSRDWSFGGTWPYEPRWLFTDGIRIHYVDEGPRDGEPVVLLHGSPAWSYVFRDAIRAIAEAGLRSVAYDQLGFGRSDKPSREAEYSLERHTRHLDALVEELELQEVTLWARGSGEATANAWAARNEGRVRKVVVDGAAPSWPPFLRVPLLGKALVKGAHVAVRASLSRSGDLGPEERAAFLAPHPSWASRSGIVASLASSPAPDALVPASPERILAATEQAR